MAIIKCHECKREISDEAKACPQCGAKPKMSVGMLGIVIACIVGLGVFQCTSRTEEAAAKRQTAEAAKSPEQKTTVKRSQPVAVTAPTWAYTTGTDEISGNPTLRASLRSINTVDLSYPYGPGVGAEFSFVRPARGAEFVALVIDKGQLLCHASDPCIAVFKFNGRDEIQVKGHRPNAGRSDAVVFDYKFSDMLDYFRRSRHLMIELPLYKDGQRVWKFDIDGLDLAKVR